MESSDIFDFAPLFAAALARLRDWLTGSHLGDGQKQVNRDWEFTSIGCLGDSCFRNQRLFCGNDR
jgi:hypothetical protein